MVITAFHDKISAGYCSKLAMVGQVTIKAQDSDQVLVLVLPAQDMDMASVLVVVLASQSS
jgi:hypothetical protein